MIPEAAQKFPIVDDTVFFMFLESFDLKQVTGSAVRALLHPVHGHRTAATVTGAARTPGRTPGCPSGLIPVGLGRCK